MSLPATKWAWKVRGLSPATKLVLLRLAEKTDARGESYPAIETIAADCEVAPRSVQRAILDLIEKRLLKKVDRIRTSSVYTLMMGDTTSPLMGDIDDIVSGGRVTFTTVRGDTMSPKPLREPLLQERKNVPSERREQARAANGNDLFGQEPLPAVNGHAKAAKPSRAPDPAKEALWQQGLPILREMLGFDDKRARTFMGRMLRETRDNAQQAFQVLINAQEAKPLDPQPWLLQACRVQGQKRNHVADVISALGANPDRFSPRSEK